MDRYLVKRPSSSASETDSAFRLPVPAGFKLCSAPEDVTGGGLIGHVRATYDHLVWVMGPPTMGPNSREVDKGTCVWDAGYEDAEGVVHAFHIYDWKTIRTPMDEYAWHIGGCDRRSIVNPYDPSVDYKRQGWHEARIIRALLHEPSYAAEPDRRIAYGASATASSYLYNLDDHGGYQVCYSTSWMYDEHAREGAA